MSSNPPDQKPPHHGSLQSMLARLRGMMQALKSSEPPANTQQEILPTWDATGVSGGNLTPAGEGTAAADEAPTAIETGRQAGSVADAVAAVHAEGFGRDFASATDSEQMPPSERATLTVAETQASPPAPQLCPYCQAPRKNQQVYCDECGWIFPVGETPAVSVSSPEARLKARYTLGYQLGERCGVNRFRGLDYATGSVGPVAVVILRARSSLPLELVPTVEATPLDTAPIDKVEPETDRMHPDAANNDDNAKAAAASCSAPLVAEAVVVQPAWPGIGWERSLLERAAHSSLPKVLDSFNDGGYDYLIEELPAGQLLWDAWDDPQFSAEQRFGWLKQIAGTLHRLHECGAILEGLRPDIVVVKAGEQAQLIDLSDLLPLPLPANPPIRATLYTAPELVLSSEQANARSDLYGFGAMLYALHLGRELTEMDFEMQGVPKSIFQRFPDIHPRFGRLVGKTFCREISQRFPTEEAAAEDPTGFAELIRNLESCRRALDHVRLDIAAWTTTGMVRSGNEDAFALLHATESSENTLGDSALVLLADGMGGYEAGEVAAAMAIHAMRRHLLGQKAFAGLSAEPMPLSDENHAPANLSTERATYKLLLAAALKEANKQVYMAAHDAAGRRGMGCTAEVIYAGGRDLVVGHVGDSRTYHLQAGNLVQVTRDQTWVNRMVELGAMNALEAEQHPRRSELHQAIGGYPDVEPALYDATLKPGDTVVVCSDGLSNHLPPETLKEILQSATSAESAARRLINLANLAGATDNATVVVIRAT